MTSVLLVDDDPRVRKMTALILERAGYGVVCAANGVEALMLYSSYGDRIAIVVSDVDMPNMNGIELAARIHAADPDARMLFVTGGSTLVPTGYRLIKKPFRPQDLVSAVQDILRRDS